MITIDEHYFLDATGQVTFYLAAGPKAGPLVIFCHGWPGIARTWVRQMECLASLGFRAVAPDMPGYGSSSVPQSIEEYALENINGKMVALLAHCGHERSIWVGHDWGAVAVWSFAAHYPEKTVAVVGLARPYHTLEFGLEEVFKTINRDVYPVKDYPHGQYDYQVYFERSYDEASKWFEKDPEGVLKAIYRNGSSVEVGKPGLTSTVTRDGGWFGGAPVPPIKLRDIPAESLCVDEELFEDIVTAMKKTGFRGANAWYLNHQRNCIYSSSRKVDGYLHMPVLFIGANWDPISDVAISSIANAQKHFCSNLQEVYLDAGHWVALEKPYEVNALIVKWLLQHVESEWPCRLDNQQHAS